MNKKRSVKKYGRNKSVEPRKKSVRHKISRRKSVKLNKRKKSVIKRKSSSKRKKSLKRKSVNRRKRDGMDDQKTIATPKKLDFDFDLVSSESEFETPKKQIIFSPYKPAVDDKVLESLIDAFSESIKPDLKKGTKEPLFRGGKEETEKVLEPSKGVDLKRGKPDIENSTGFSPPLKKPKIDEKNLI